MGVHFTAGARVRTKDFGAGTVLKALSDGALVRFDDYGETLLRQDFAALTLLDDAPHATRAPLGPPPGRRVGNGPPPPNLQERQAIEALRFGLVPYAALDELTLGYDHLRKWTLRRLPDAHGGVPQVSAVFGPFGAGKSHTMAVIRRVSEQSGYLTAHVEVDGQTVSLAEPEKLLNSLWGTLRGEYFRSSTPLLDLYVAAAQKWKSVPAVAPYGIDRTLHNFTVIKEAVRRDAIGDHGEALDAVLASSPTISAGAVNTQLRIAKVMRTGEVATMKRIIGGRVDERPYDFVEALAGHATMAERAGYRGIVLTIDEFEVDQSLLTPAKQERLVHLLQVLHKYLMGKTDHRAAPLALFFATVGEDGHTGDGVVEQLIGDRPEAHYELHPWLLEEDLRDLAARIDRLYAAAYGLVEPIDDSLVARVEADLNAMGSGDSGLIRAFIKRYVGVLDVRYGPPEK
jgi:hypothetical protein